MVSIVKRRRRRQIARPPFAFVLPAALLIAALVAYPMFELIHMSVSDVRPKTLLGVWPFVGLDNFVEVFADPRFSLVMMRTAVFGAVVLVIGLVGGLCAALAIRRRTRLNSLAYALMVLMWALPAIVNAVIWRYIFSNDGALNQFLIGIGIIDEPILFLVSGWMPLLSVAWVAGWVALPFATIIFRAAMLDVPEELYEAAEVDGAGPVSRFRNVTLPSIMPTIVVVGILLLSWAVRSFDFTFGMTQGGPGDASTTLPVAGYLAAFSLFDYSKGAAIAVLTVVIVLLIAIPYTRWNARGQR